MKQANKPVIIIAGPTAVGKTEATIALAKDLDTEIISCDSMQIYKGMTIGSAKPTIEEQQGIRHHLMDFLDPHEPYSVSDYSLAAKSIIKELHDRGKVPIVTGGTGLYVNSLLYDMPFSEKSADSALRVNLEKELQQIGPIAFHQKLKDLDPSSASRIHFNNTRKVMRALEIVLQGGSPEDFKTDLIPETSYLPHLFVLNRDRDELYERINLRVEIMLEAGLLDEVRCLMELGLTSDHQSMKGIGYKEVIAYLNGTYDYEVMVDTLKQNSRRYAKRQLTWFRRYNQANWLNLSEFDGKLQAINGIMEAVKSRL
ncbi:tRNA (adenosine(37)-N6)-dimethylallyltransferase MiaA [Fusibacter sp. A1]|nr:tRNA (adenosine(37)-N6)-dimethylallyltransferase MiaA [Fusibacter sp. A1]RXV61614.1 tRNA (adenosine(37)-N6)-dimethylallyltransferase MiaA [Fusibacter sp. A1]